MGSDDSSQSIAEKRLNQLLDTPDEYLSRAELREKRKLLKAKRSNCLSMTAVPVETKTAEEPAKELEKKTKARRAKKKSRVETYCNHNGRR